MMCIRILSRCSLLVTTHPQCGSSSPFAPRNWIRMSYCSHPIINRRDLGMLHGFNDETNWNGCCMDSVGIGKVGSEQASSFVIGREILWAMLVGQYDSLMCILCLATAQLPGKKQHVVSEMQINHMTMSRVRRAMQSASRLDTICVGGAHCIDMRTVMILSSA